MERFSPLFFEAVWPKESVGPGSCKLLVSCGTEYAQARIQARFGGRPDAELWRELRSIRGLGAFLDAARASPLHCWVTGIDASGDLHQIEAELRRRFRAHIREVAGWMPSAWRPGVLWLLSLLDLPALAHLLAGNAPYPWMSRDEAIQHLAADGAGRGRAASAPDSLRRGAGRRRAGVAPGGAPALHHARAAWLAEWERRMPPRVARAPAMRRLLTTISAHLERFSRASVHEAWQARAALEHDLRVLFRRFTLLPEAAFAYLGLVALDLERLRAELIRRALWQRERAAA